MSEFDRLSRLTFMMACAEGYEGLRGERGARAARLWSRLDGARAREAVRLRRAGLSQEDIDRGVARALTAPERTRARNRASRS